MKSKKNSLLSIGRLLSSLSVPFRQIRRGPIKPEWMSFSWKTRQAKCKRLPFIGIFLFSLLTVTVLTQKEISSKRLQTWRSVMKKSGLLSFIWIITWKSTTKRTPFIECPCCIKGFACSILFNPDNSPKWQVEVHSLNACLLTSPHLLPSTTLCFGFGNGTDFHPQPLSDLFKDKFSLNCSAHPWIHSETIPSFPSCWITELHHHTHFLSYFLILEPEVKEGQIVFLVPL